MFESIYETRFLTQVCKLLNHLKRYSRHQLQTDNTGTKQNKKELDRPVSGERKSEMDQSISPRLCLIKNGNAIFSLMGPDSLLNKSINLFQKIIFY